MPGLSFLARVAPICLSVFGLALLLWGGLFVAMKVGQNFFDFGGQTLRDYVGWSLKPKNLFVLFPLLLIFVTMLLMILGLIFGAQYL